MAMPVSVTLSSAGTSRAVNLDWMSGKSVLASVTFGSTSMTAGYTIQTTLDDLQTIASSLVVWVDGSSLTTATSTNFSFIPSPAGIRINSTGVSSSSLVLRVTQGIGW